MPFINSKISVKATEEQKTELKKRLGQAIAIIIHAIAADFDVKISDFWGLTQNPVIEILCSSGNTCY